MSNPTPAIAALLADHGVRLAQTADGLTQETNDHLRELADTIVALILATDFDSHEDLTVLDEEVKQAVSAVYQRISAQSIASIVVDLPAPLPPTISACAASWLSESVT